MFRNVIRGRCRVRLSRQRPTPVLGLTLHSVLCRSMAACAGLDPLLLYFVDHEKASVEEAFDAVGEAARFGTGEACRGRTRNAPYTSN